MAEYKPGTICSVRGSKDDWQVIGTQFDGLVMKYVVQSRNSGEVKRVFNFEVFEKYTSTYQDINDFFKSVTGIGLDENLDFLDDDIDDTEISAINSAITGLEQTNDDVELKDQVIQQANKRFKAVSETDISKLRGQNTEKTTDSSTKWAVGLLRVWMSENEFLNDSFEYMDPVMLDSILQQFYASLQSKKGDHYSKSALVGIRAGINRHLTAPPYSRLLNLMKDRDFMVSNQVLTGLIKGLKRDGNDISKHKEPITEEDNIKLYESGLFSLNKPETLQNKVIYETIAQFGRRGREGLHLLKKDSFTIKTDVRGRRFLIMTYNEADKTHHGLDSREKAKVPRMYEEPGNEFCPLLSFEKYVSKLHPGCERLFQRPQRMFKGEVSDIWFENSPIGIQKLNGFMARLSKDANLSQRYTNHCIRAFVSTHLKRNGFSNEAIMGVTGHRNVQSLTAYIQPHDDEKHEVSKSLTYKRRDSSMVQTHDKDYSEVVQIENPICQSRDQIPSTQNANDMQFQVEHLASSTSLSSLNVSSGHEYTIFSGAVNAGTININIYKQ